MEQPEAGNASAGATALAPRPVPAPSAFEATGAAVWDGRRTLGGIWVAHPEAGAAQRVRIHHDAGGKAVDGVLLRRDAPLTGPPLLVSSDAAQALGMQAGEPTELRIVALAGTGAEAAGASAESAENAAVQ